MDNRDRQIAILNCNTVAAQLMQRLEFDNLLSMLDTYEAVLDSVMNKVLGAIGTDAVLRAFPEATPVAVVEATAQPQGLPQAPTGNLQVVGQQHGALPSWLVQQCAAAGITKVYDNRVDRDGNDITTNPANKRPWFKAADGSDKAFWPPKTGARR